jgi:hypothetical protein
VLAKEDVKGSAGVMVCLDQPGRALRELRIAQVHG